MRRPKGSTIGTTMVSVGTKLTAKKLQCGFWLSFPEEVPMCFHFEEIDVWGPWCEEIAGWVHVVKKLTSGGHVVKTSHWGSVCEEVDVWCPFCEDLALGAILLRN